MKMLLALLLIWTCHSLPSSAGALEFMSSADGFAVCSGADVASTIAAVQQGAAETNPLWRNSVNDRHYAPLILGNVLLVGLAYHFESSFSKSTFLLVNVIRCGVAGANLRLVF